MTYTLASLEMNLHANVAWSVQNTLGRMVGGDDQDRTRRVEEKKVLNDGTLTISRMLVFFWLYHKLQK